MEADCFRKSLYRAAYNRTNDDGTRLGLFLTYNKISVSKSSISISISPQDFLALMMTAGKRKAKENGKADLQ